MKTSIFKISKAFVFSLLFVGFATAQNPFELYTTPAGTLDDAFDRFGKKYKLSELKKPESNLTPFALPLNTISTSRFNLYYESGCGMELETNTTHIARRKIVEKVLADVSAFIDLPFSEEAKVNIWVRNLANVTTNTNQTMSVGSSFYNVPKNATGSITDGEVWKTLLSGNDSYTNVPPTPDAYYHGMLAFNFATYNNSLVKWHTKLESNPPAGFYDFYSAVLREVTHLLGLTSLMDANGNSVFGADYKYYSHYDRLLKNNANTQPLIKNTGTVAMYNYSFNTALSPTILRPGCSLPNYTNPSPADATTCANALKYVGSTTLPVYTPTCFEKGVSLSHFEDQLFPSCTSAYGNNSYFVMSNKSNLQSVKRYLKPQERLALADLGYPLKTIYGTTTTLNGYYNYGGSPTASNAVVGVNDGINPDFTFAFIGTAGSNITITGNQLLSNDTNATTFEGLQDLTAPATTTLSATTGNASTTITFTSTTPGIHLLRYIPKNAAGQSGNVTYFYVFVDYPVNYCATTPVCNLVYNGDFEQNNGQIPSNQSQLYYACNWQQHNAGTPDYFHSNATAWQVDIPTNVYGNQSVNNGIGNAYAGFYMLKSDTDNWFQGEILKTKLQSPLLGGVNYTLKFDVSKAENSINLSQFINFKIPFLISATNYENTTNQFLTTDELNDGIFMQSANYVSNTTGWDTLTFTFTAAGGEEYLYLGGLFLTEYETIIPNSFYSYYYIDNVVLTETSNMSISNNDSQTFTQDSTAQTATTSVLANDTINGTPLVAPYTGITVTQVSTTNAGVSINPQGLVTVAGGTPAGTYTLVYNFTTPCGVSNNATVTVEVTPNSPVIVAYKHSMQFSCWDGGNQTSTNSLYDYTYIGGLLATPAEVVFVNTTPIPSGVTINPNGTITIDSSLLPNQYISFTGKYCQVGNPTNCSDEVVVAVSMIQTVIANPNYANYTTAGMFVPIGEFTSNNVLSNDSFLSCNNDVIEPTNATYTTLTQLPPYNSYFQILADGTVNIIPGSAPIPVGTYTLNYKICDNNNPNICSQSYVTIHVSNSFRIAPPKPKNNQARGTQNTADATDPIINIPDPNLKARLTATNIGFAAGIVGTSYYVDTNLDGEIQLSEALNIWYLNLNASNTSDLTGIEHFINLKSLGCGNNNLTTINLPTLTLLENIGFYQNSISSIDLSIYPNIQAIGCQNTLLTTLDFRNNPLFTTLNCSDSNLSTIYLKNNINQIFNSELCWSNNPLSYICADAMEIPALQSFLTSCGYNLANITITSDCALGANTFTKEVVKVYPNPSNTGVFSVELPVVSKGNAMVYNALGQKVYENTFVNQAFTLPLNFLPKGTYFLKLITENQEVFEEKLVVN